MLDKINLFKKNKNKKNWKPYHEELFQNLTSDNIDDSIKPYIELLKTSDFKKAMKTIKGWMHLFDNSEFIETSFKKFVDYLLEDNRYKELFAEGMRKNVLKWENKELYNEVYETTLLNLELILGKIKKWKKNSITPFFISQVIKILRWELFVFKLWEWFIWFEKDYLYGEDAKKINEDHSEKPVYWYRIHVGENAAIYSLDTVLKSMNEFLKNTETWAQPYVWLRSWLLDTEFVKYRLKNKKKKWSNEKIDNFINTFYWRLWTITPEKIKDEKSYNRISRRIKNHLRDEDKALVDAYENEWNRIVEWQCLLDLNEYCKNN